MPSNHPQHDTPIPRKHAKLLETVQDVARDTEKAGPFVRAALRIIAELANREPLPEFQEVLKKAVDTVEIIARVSKKDWPVGPGSRWTSAIEPVVQDLRRLQDAVEATYQGHTEDTAKREIQLERLEATLASRPMHVEVLKSEQPHTRANQSATNKLDQSAMDSSSILKPLEDATKVSQGTRELFNVVAQLAPLLAAQLAATVEAMRNFLGDAHKLRGAQTALESFVGAILRTYTKFLKDQPTRSILNSSTNVIFVPISRILQELREWLDDNLRPRRLPRLKLRTSAKAGKWLSRHDFKLQSALRNLELHLEQERHSCVQLTSTLDVPPEKSLESAVFTTTLAYAVELAPTLHTHSIRLSDAGFPSEALAATRECLQLRRAWQQEQPNSYAADLASTLFNYSIDLSEAGRQAEALAAIEECLQLRRALQQEQPNAHAADLATTLYNYSNVLREAGRHAEALTASEQCLQLRTTLHQEQPDTYAAALAEALYNHSFDLNEAAQHAQALVLVGKALKLYTALHQEQPAVYGTALEQAQKLHAILGSEGESPKLDKASLDMASRPAQLREYAPPRRLRVNRSGMRRLAQARARVSRDVNRCSTPTPSTRTARRLASQHTMATPSIPSF
ncbi:hypothetical protein V8E36_005188 [Tilletia maclaganii]